MEGSNTSLLHPRRKYLRGGPPEGGIALGGSGKGGSSDSLNREDSKKKEKPLEKGKP